MKPLTNYSIESIHFLSRTLSMSRNDTRSERREPEKVVRGFTPLLGHSHKPTAPHADSAVRFVLPGHSRCPVHFSRYSPAVTVGARIVRVQRNLSQIHARCERLDFRLRGLWIARCLDRTCQLFASKLVFLSRYMYKDYGFLLPYN